MNQYREFVSYDNAYAKFDSFAFLPSPSPPSPSTREQSSVATIPQTFPPLVKNPINT